MVRGWLARGVDGFRLDVFNLFLKDPELRSNPVQPGTSAWTRQVHIHDRDQPDFMDLIGRFRAIVDEEPGRMSVGELFDGTIETAAAMTAERHLVFDWELIGTAWTPAAVCSAIATRERAFGDDHWPTVVFSNHDQPRHASRLAASAPGSDPDAIARAAAVLLLTARGTPFLYYGEELGMQDVDIPPEESVDPPASHVGPDFAWWDRSRCRTPMPWAPGPGAGFTTGRPWLRFGPDVSTRNVETQRGDPGSVLSFYRRLIALRAAMPALQDGALRIQDGQEVGVVAYTRETARTGGARRTEHRSRAGQLAAARRDRIWRLARGALHRRHGSLARTPGRWVDHRPPRRRGGRVRGDRLTSTSGAPATMTATHPDARGGDRCRSIS